MKRSVCIVVLVLAAGCTSARGQEDRALSLEREVEKLAGMRSLWPGFEPLMIPLAVYDGERTYVFRHPAPPDGFVALGDAERGIHVYEGRHPAIIANTSTEFGGSMTATLVMDGSEPGRSLTDLAAVALHETFHVYQRERHPGWQANEGELFVYPTSDAQLLALRRLETEALRRAHELSGSMESACWASRANLLRGQRFAQMNPAFAEYERGTELNEGLATYVELRAKGLETVSLPADGFDAAEVRRRAYATGPAFAFLLDRFSPGWRESFEIDDGKKLDQALQAALRSDDQSSPDRCTFSDAEVVAAGRAARQDTAAVLARQVERMAAFEAQSGWRVTVTAADDEPLWPSGFDPLNVEVVRGGVLHLRFLHLGNDSGQLEAMDIQEADIEALTEGVGPHPLFNGIQRVVIAGLAKPEVAIDGEHVSVSAPGLTASFERASVRQSAGHVVLVLEAPQ